MRVWIDWEDNTYGKRGYARMIYYTNIGTIAPDNSYLVFNAEGSILDNYQAPLFQTYVVETSFS